MLAQSANADTIRPHLGDDGAGASNGRGCGSCSWTWFLWFDKARMQGDKVAISEATRSDFGAEDIGRTLPQSEDNLLTRVTISVIRANGNDRFLCWNHL
jgi:hypothetical protein